MNSPDIAVHVAGSGRRRRVEELESVVIRFVGDSGDGMQLTGNEFAKSVARAGHDFATHPDYPSEIRAPTGTLFGVSGYQIQFSSGQVFNSGDAPDVLVAMNPAALKTNLPDLKHGGVIIANSGAFTEGNLHKAGYGGNPLDDGSLADLRLYRIDISQLTSQALMGLGLSKKEAGRCKNYFALGLMLYLYGRPLDAEEDSIRAIRQEARHRRSQHRGASRGPCLRRVDGDVRHHVPDRVRGHRTRNVSKPHRQSRGGARLRRRVGAGRRSAVPRLVPDHAGHRHPA